MPIKSISGPRCMRHQIECMYNCGWCSKPICDECVVVAGGKKYCDKCWTKKQQTAPKESFDSSKPVGPRQPIKNIDPSLDPKLAEQRRVVQEALKKKTF